jgi:hypothetical protein
MHGIDAPLGPGAAETSRGKDTAARTVFRIKLVLRRLGKKPGAHRRWPTRRWVDPRLRTPAGNTYTRSFKPSAGNPCRRPVTPAVSSTCARKRLGPALNQRRLCAVKSHAQSNSCGTRRLPQRWVCLIAPPPARGSLQARTEALSQRRQRQNVQCTQRLCFEPRASHVPRTCRRR